MKSTSSDPPSDKRSDDEEDIEEEKVNYTNRCAKWWIIPVFNSSCVTRVGPFQEVALVKAPSRRNRADRVVEKEDGEDEDEEHEQEEVSSSGERELLEKEGKREIKEESWDIKDTKEPKEKKETKPLEVVHKQEESMEKVKYKLYFITV